MGNKPQRSGLLASLRQLAGLYGVQTAYYDTRGRRQTAQPDSLLAVLQRLGAPVHALTDVPDAVRLRRQAWWHEGIEPVVPLWHGGLASVELRLPQALASARIDCRLELDDGDLQSWNGSLAEVPTLQASRVEGTDYVVKNFTFADPLPLGYHRLELETAGTRFEARLIVAPKRAYTPPADALARTWGVFLPLYALQSDESWGIGDFSDLQSLSEWVAELGGGVVATLPLLSAFLDTPYEPSPYAPASRLFWNEVYVDVNRAPGLSECPAAQARVQSPSFQMALTEAQAAPRVDYRRVMDLKRRVLEPLARWFFAAPRPQHQAFQDYLQGHPAADAYARFRAVGERQGAPWPQWPESLRDGQLTEADADPDTHHYHLYVQWQAHEQLAAAVSHGKTLGVRLYLDMPLGVHPHSFDVWCHRDLFVRDADVGAPPDAFFTRGQNWGFPPLHPQAIRQQGYGYWIEVLRHQFRQTGLLRLDHVMGLHRLFWIPHGLEASQGVYVRYPAEELYAILNLESHRHRVCLVGENLGTVPAYVNTTMARHHLHRLYVVQYQIHPDADPILPRVPRDTVASLNTHDMPPFAAFLQGLDIADRLQQGLLTADDAQREHEDRQHQVQVLQAFLRQQGLLAPAPADASAVLSACLAFLSASASRVVQVSLEDLWLETQPQNVPGTSDERPNWQRKARYRLEALRHMPQVLAILRTVNHLRKQGRTS